MQVLISFFFFLLGAAIGSFLNVIVLRYNTGKTIGGRSMCLSCGVPIFWYDLIPVLGFFLVSRKCRACGSKISWQYPVVECITGALFLLLHLKLSSLFFSLEYVLFFVFYGVLLSSLVAITVYDIRHKIIPDSFALIFSASALALLMAKGELGFFSLLPGLILALPFAFLWFISRGTWMGLGDAKLAIGIGFFLGFSGGTMAILLAFWVGALFGIVLLFLKMLFKNTRLSKLFPHLTMKSEIPFGPFLILGTLLVFFLNLDLSLLGFPLI